MARVFIKDENREISDVNEIRGFLSSHGIWFENWDVAGRVDKDSTDQEILEAYEPEINRLKAKHGFVTSDIINVCPDTPNLDVMLAKFDKEHTHDEDEVRFTIEGRGLFHIHPETGPVFSITVEAGDLINVPKGTRHWFNLCSSRMIRCIRLFEDQAGWTPHYVDNSKHMDHPPICFGPEFVQGNGEIDSVVEL